MPCITADWPYLPINSTNTNLLRGHILLIHVDLLKIHKRIAYLHKDDLEDVNSSSNLEILRRSELPSFLPPLNTNDKRTIGELETNLTSWRRQWRGSGSWLSSPLGVFLTRSFQSLYTTYDQHSKDCNLSCINSVSQVIMVTTHYNMVNTNLGNHYGKA
jgi:hypothetical protein